MKPKSASGLTGVNDILSQSYQQGPGARIPGVVSYKIKSEGGAY